jgi:sigma-E factor negative regulatory protein RseA
LHGTEFARVVNLVSDDADARSTWQVYHLVGDVMRSGDGAVGGDVSLEGDFVARFRNRLQHALTASAVSTLVAMPDDESNLIANNLYLTGTSGIIFSKNTVANDSSYRWKLLAAVASVAAVLAVSWGIISTGDNGGNAPQLVQSAPPVLPDVALATVVPQVMLRDPHLDALLAAHKQFGGTSALQMPAGFLRNATFEGPAR